MDVKFDAILGKLRVSDDYGASGYSGLSGYSGSGVSGYSGSGVSGYSGSGKSGYSGYSGYSGTAANVMTLRGFIYVNGDFPAAPSNGDVYFVKGSVTDPYHTNQSFTNGTEIVYVTAEGEWDTLGTNVVGVSGYSGYSGSGISGYSGSGVSGYSGSGTSGYSGYSGIGTSGYSGKSGYSGNSTSGYSGISGYSGNSTSGYSGKSGYSGYSGFSGYSGSGISGYSGYSGIGGSGYSGYSGYSGSGVSGYSGAGTSGYSGKSGYSGASTSGYSGYSGSGVSGYSGSGVSGYSGYSGGGVSTSAENDWSAAQTVTEGALTSSSGSVTWDTDTKQNATITLTENITGWTVQNAKAGRYVSIRITQHASAAKTIIWDSGTFKGMTGYTMSTGTSKVDHLVFRCVSTSVLELVGFRQDIAS